MNKLYYVVAKAKVEHNISYTQYILHDLIDFQGRLFRIWYFDVIVDCSEDGLVKFVSLLDRYVFQQHIEGVTRGLNITTFT